MALPNTFPITSEQVEAEFGLTRPWNISDLIGLGSTLPDNPPLLASHLLGAAAEFTTNITVGVNNPTFGFSYGFSGIPIEFGAMGDSFDDSVYGNVSILKVIFEKTNSPGNRTVEMMMTQSGGSTYLPQDIFESITTAGVTLQSSSATFTKSSGHSNSSAWVWSGVTLDEGIFTVGRVEPFLMSF